MEVIEFVIQHPEKYATWNASIDCTTGQTLALYATDYTVYSESTLLDLPSGAVQLIPIFYEGKFGYRNTLHMLPEKHWEEFYLLLERDVDYYSTTPSFLLLESLYQPLATPFWTNRLVKTCYLDREEEQAIERTLKDLSLCPDLTPSAFSHDQFSFSKKNGKDAGAILFTGTYSQCMRYQMQRCGKR